MSKMVGLSMLASITTTKPCSPADMPIPFKQASHSLQDSGRVGTVHAWGAAHSVTSFNLSDGTLTLHTSYQDVIFFTLRTVARFKM